MSFRADVIDRIVLSSSNSSFQLSSRQEEPSTSEMNSTILRVPSELIQNMTLIHRHLLVTLLLCSLPEILSAQVILYRTFQDFQANIGEVYDDHMIAKISFIKVRLELKKNGKDTLVDPKEHWGFRFRDALFRIEGKYKQPVRVISAGKIIYYENGPANIQMIMNESSSATIRIGYLTYLSKDLTSDIYPLPSSPVSDAKKWYKKFRKQYPEYQELYDCIDKSLSYEVNRKCISEFEKVE